MEQGYRREYQGYGPDYETRTVRNTATNAVGTGYARNKLKSQLRIIDIAINDNQEFVQ